MERQCRTLSVLQKLAMPTDKVQVNFVMVTVFQPGGAAIIFPESWNFELRFSLLNHFWEKNDLFVLLDSYLAEKQVKMAEKCKLGTF